MVVDSQTATGAPETPCREAWTDAQPRDSPVYYSPPSLPGASAEVGTPQVKLPDAQGAPEQAVLCTPKEAQIPAATPNEESDVGDSASVAPEPESKRDPMYWRFLDQHQYQSQQAAESLYFQMGGVHPDHFGFETLHWAWKSICISATIILSSPDWNPSQPFPSKAAKVFYTTCWWWAQMLPGSPQALGHSWWV